MSASRQGSLLAPDPAIAGFRYQADLLSRKEEGRLLTQIETLPFRAFEFHGYLGNRRTVSFGWRYDFSGQGLVAVEEIPGFLLPVRERAAEFGGLAPDDLTQVLVTEYSPGARIGWHKDKAVFGDVIGVSLRSPCIFRFRQRAGATWRRTSFRAEPRSAYLLTDEARLAWEHSIPPLESLRYSITFRTLRHR